MSTRLWLSTIILAFGMLALSGCGAQDGGGIVDESLTLQDAKMTAMNIETDLAAMIPANVVGSVDQRQTGVLMSCSGERAYQWTGQTQITYRTPGAIDPSALVDEIVAAYSDRAGFTAKSAPLPDGEPGAHVIGAHGSGYLVNENVDRTGIEILSFSPCFVLPEGMSPGEEY